MTTRTQMLIAAANEIHRVGLQGARLSEITSAAGVTTGAVYFHFESKQGLARALVDLQHRVVRAAAEQILRASDDSPVVLMMRLCADLAARLQTDPVVRAGILLTTAQSTFSASIREPYCDWLETFTALVAQAQEAGEMTRDLSPDALARFIVPAFTGIQLVSESFSARQDLLLRVHGLWQVLILAVVPAAQQRGLLATAQQLFAGRGGG